MVHGNRRTVLATLGRLGAVAVGASLAGCSTGDGDTPSPTPGGDAATVEMTDELTFVPETIEVPAGTTVVWENVGQSGHSVTAYEDEIPDGADYFASGGFDDEAAARDGYAAGDPDAGDVPGGESYEHTFEVAGTYGYFCIPHESAGMTGTVEVTE